MFIGNLAYGLPRDAEDGAIWCDDDGHVGCGLLGLFVRRFFGFLRLVQEQEDDAGQNGRATERVAGGFEIAVQVGVLDVGVDLVERCPEGIVGKGFILIERVHAHGGEDTAGDQQSATHTPGHPGRGRNLAWGVLVAVAVKTGFDFGVGFGFEVVLDVEDHGFPDRVERGRGVGFPFCHFIGVFPVGEFHRAHLGFADAAGFDGASFEALAFVNRGCGTLDAFESNLCQAEVVVALLGFFELGLDGLGVGLARVSLALHFSTVAEVVQDGGDVCLVLTSEAIGEDGQLGGLVEGLLALGPVFLGVGVDAGAVHDLEARADEAEEFFEVVVGRGRRGHAQAAQRHAQGDQLWQPVVLAVFHGGLSCVLTRPC